MSSHVSAHFCGAEREYLSFSDGNLPEFLSLHNALRPVPVMICNAKALQRAVKELQWDGSDLKDSDSLLFWGRLMGEPILLSLAIEIALKAWQCQERRGAPHATHDLLKLFEGLEQATQERLEAKLPALLDPELGWTIREGLRGRLAAHRNAHTHWRYLYEAPHAQFEASALDEALTVIIDAWCQRWYGGGVFERE